MKRPRSARWVAPLAATAFVTALSGCASLASPAVITTPYQAADGTNFELPGSSVHLANFVVVGMKKGEPASVVGSVINDGSTAVELNLTSAGGATGGRAEATVNVPAGGSTQIGPDKDTSMTLAELPVDPGAELPLNAATSTSGTAAFSVPVVRTTGYYESLTPSPTPSPTPSASRTRRAGSGSGNSSGKSSGSSSSSSTSSTPTPSPTS